MESVGRSALSPESRRRVWLGFPDVKAAISVSVSVCNICVCALRICQWHALGRSESRRRVWLGFPDVKAAPPQLQSNCSGAADPPRTGNRLQCMQCSAYSRTVEQRSGNRWHCMSILCIVHIALCFALHVHIGHWTLYIIHGTLHIAQCMSTLDIVRTRTHSSWFSSAARFRNTRMKWGHFSN